MKRIEYMEEQGIYFELIEKLFRLDNLFSNPD